MASDTEEEVDDIVACDNCLEDEGFILNPKRLPCGHVFCEICLTSRQLDDSIKCNKCGEQTTVGDLPSALKKPTFCDTCKTKGIPHMTARVYCVECDRKFCAKHREAHLDLNNHHQVLTVTDYLKSTYAQEVRFCNIHKDRILSIGCTKCWVISCAKCLSSINPCNKGGNHNLVSMEEVAEEVKKTVEPLKVIAEDRFDEISAMVKELTITLSGWDLETEEGVKLINTLRDQQVITEKYDKLSEDYVNSRKSGKEKITDYIAEEAGVRMSEFLEQLKKLRADLSEMHPVDLVTEKMEIEKKINRLIAEDFPTLLLNGLRKPQIADENRNLEITLLPVDDVIIGDQIGGANFIPPTSMQRVKEVKLRTNCGPICHYKGFTYVGYAYAHAVDRIDAQGTINPDFIKLSSHVVTIRALNDQLFILDFNGGAGFKLSVFDTAGKLVTSWIHADKTGHMWGNRITITKDQQHLAVIDNTNQRITIYSLMGNIIRHVPCKLLTTNSHVAMRETGDDSVVISHDNSSTVIKLNLASGDVEWTCNKVNRPGGVALLDKDYVAVAQDGCAVSNKQTKVWIISVNTGELVGEITDPVAGQNASYVFDLYAEKDTLAVTRYSDNAIVYYKLGYH